MFKRAIFSALKSVVTLLIAVTFAVCGFVWPAPSVCAEGPFENYLSVAACAKNEGKYFQEWIEYHRLVGVEKFYIYDNESTDNTREILEPYIQAGIVEYKYFPGTGIQLAAYTDAIETCKYKTYWCAFIDLDEFIVPVEGGTVANLLKEYEDYSGLVAYWLTYGSSGYITEPEGLVLENYKMHSQTTDKLEVINHKSIVKPRNVSDVGAHNFRYREGGCVDESKGTVQRCPPLRNRIRVNHYRVKSIEQYLSKNSRQDVYFRLRDCPLPYCLSFFDKMDANKEREEPNPELMLQLKERLAAVRSGTPLPTTQTELFELPDITAMNPTELHNVKMWMLDAMTSKKWRWLVETKFKVLDQRVKDAYVKLLKSARLEALRQSIPHAPVRHVKFKVPSDEYYKRCMRDLGVTPAQLAQRESSTTDETAFENYLSIAVMIQNESPYLKEFIDYHRLVGVEKFFIYDNESDDNTREILEPYIQAGVVEYTYYPGKARKRQMYVDALEACKDKTYWCAFIDLDEFIVPTEHATLPELLQEYEDYSGVVANWRMYGSDGNITAPDGLVLENYKSYASLSFERNAPVKSIVKPRLAQAVNSAHKFNYSSGFAVDENKEPCAGWSRPPSYDKISINHYYLKSLQEFIHKCSRGCDCADICLPYPFSTFTHYDRNEVNKMPIPLANVLPLLKERCTGTKQIDRKGLEQIIRNSPDTALLPWLLDAISTPDWQKLVNHFFTKLPFGAQHRVIDMLERQIGQPLPTIYPNSIGITNYPYQFPDASFNLAGCVDHLKHIAERSIRTLDQAPVVISMSLDNNYIHPTAIAVTSLLENANYDTFYKIYLLVPGNFHEDNRQKLSSLQTKYGNCEFVFINMEGEFADCPLPPGKGAPSPCTFYRLKIPSIVSGFDRCLHLDSDTFITCDLTELYNTPLGENWIAGVRDQMSTYPPEEQQQRPQGRGIHDFSHYINNGVILMDLAALRQNHVEERWLARLDEFRGNISDQNITNFVCLGKILNLPFRYNVQSYLRTGVPHSRSKLAQTNFSPQEWKEGLQSPSIIHYTQKPWKFPQNSTHSDLWWQHAHSSPLWPEIEAKYFGALSEPDRALVLSFFSHGQPLRGGEEASRLQPKHPSNKPWWTYARRTSRWKKDET